ncbi:MAG: glucose-6-phosphate isomerase [Oscillospiraceae bacterium]|nr:glucose-6-phosphate isomerase [Oscillospiraceae bacterium]
MAYISFDYRGALPFISENELAYLEPYAKLAGGMIAGRTGPGADFLGWVDLPEKYDRAEFEKIKACANAIRDDSDILVVVGIGGSYLGARAGFEALSHNFAGMLGKSARGGAQLLFAGNSLSAPYLTDVLDVLEDRDFSINVISKSGTTTEPAIAFRVLKEFAINKYGREGAAKRIYATTDKSRGALKSLADTEGYETFVVPDDVGGRYSVLTAVGLLPLAAAGIDIDTMMAGAGDMARVCAGPIAADSPAAMYAMVRNALLRKGFTTEILVNYEPNLHYFNEWWKQLYGESEGKDHKGIFPASVDFTSDLHSMGQYIQDGMRNLFETTLSVDKPKRNISIKELETDMDGLNFLAGREVDYVNKMAAKGTYEAHMEGGAPNLIVGLPALDAASFGAAVYFFEWACALSGYLLGVNPFDQPGVEFYKANMFRLLGKPGY